MKKLIVIFGMAVALLGFMALSAQAQVTTFSLTFDENGNGQVTTNGITSSDIGVLGTSPDGFTDALSYALPVTVIGGAVGVWDNAIGTSAGGVLSDLLLFQTDSQTLISTMWFYSSPGTDLADLSPANWATVLSTYIVSGYVDPSSDVLEANDGSFVYSPLGTSSIQYLGNSSSAAVPEPSTLLLLGSGLVGLAAYRLRKRS